MNHCDYCELADKCELANGINFCEDCKDYHSCPICGVTCEMGHDIECNNGFEDKNDYCSEDEEEMGCGE